MEFPNNATLLEMIASAIDHAGGVAAASRKTGIPVGTLNKYVAGTSMPSLDKAVKIAMAAGKPIADLIIVDRMSGRTVLVEAKNSRLPGESPATPINAQYLRDALMIVEEWLDSNDLTMAPAKKADVVTQLYEFIVDDAAQGRGEVDIKRMHGILRLVA